MAKATPKKPRPTKMLSDARQACLDELEGHSATPEPDEVEEEAVDDAEDEQAEADVEADEPIHPIAVKVEKPLKKAQVSRKVEDVLDEVYTSTAKESKKEEKDFDRPKRKFPWIWVSVGIVLCAAAAAGGFWFFSRGPKFSETGVTTTVVAPSSVSSGDSVDIVFR